MDWAKLWPSVSMLVVTLVSAFQDQLQALVSAHPMITIVLGTVATIIANITKAPQAPHS